MDRNMELGSAAVASAASAAAAKGAGTRRGDQIHAVGVTMKLASFKGTRPGIAGLFSIACRWWLGGPYTHTELVFSDGWAGTSRAVEGGVVLHKITYPADEWDLIEIDGDEALARAWFVLHAGAKFDYIGLAGFVLSRGTHEGQRWFCSEAVAASLGFSEPFRFDPCTLPNVFKRVK